MKCFNCQEFGHHEDNCSANIGSVCENCGASEHAQLTSRCKGPPKCVNCGLGHLSICSECEVWKREMLRIKVTKTLPTQKQKGSAVAQW